jgi:hypothetical protein
MGILELIAAIFKPAAELIENLHTSEGEKLTLQKESAYPDVARRSETSYRG